ncbi:MAG: DNA adenine methylase [Methanomicrobia archaeon]|nr:DNA adenine methylase [Methanomicrobia archaeon]
MKASHPFPYQGSKRNIASDILQYFPSSINTLFEPFAGSAAISIAAAMRGRAKRFYINDLNKALVDLIKKIVEEPEIIADQYVTLWTSQLDNPRLYYDDIREKFNLTGRSDYLLYLLARCVKGSIRYNANGEFNQSPDNRRKGMRPKTIRENILGVSHLLKGKSIFSSRNYRDVLELPTQDDLVYMDPPYQGVCGNRDTRYLAGIQFYEFVAELEELNNKRIRFIISYDGRTGEKMHGKKLPDYLELTHIEIEAGRSSQETLLGRNASTVESLYLSPALIDEIGNSLLIAPKQKQLGLVGQVYE